MTLPASALARAHRAPAPIDRGPLTEREGALFLASCPFADCDDAPRAFDDDALVRHLAEHVHAEPRGRICGAMTHAVLVARRIVGLRLAADAAPAGSLGDALLTALGNRGDVADLEHLADDVGERSARCRSALRRLAACGAVAELDGARWRLVATRRISR